MRRFYYPITFVTLIAMTVYGQQAAFDCKQRPPLTPDVKNCCRRPVINIDKYKNQCFKNTLTGRMGVKSLGYHAFMNPCGIECIYNQAGALSNGRLVMPNMRALVNEIIPNSPELSTVIVTGLQKCGPEVQQKMQEFQASQPARFPGQQEECSPFAVLVTFCAMRHTFINCPESLWTSSNTCNSAQNYLRNCEPMQFGGPRG